MNAELNHVPVALERCIQLLTPVIEKNPEAVIIDCTLGAGGHAKLLLERFKTLHLIGIDRDQSALDLAAAKRAADGNPRATYDITQLPTQYDDNTVVDNPNVGGLVVGRPWVYNLPGAPLITDSGDTLITDSGDTLITD
jgi:16S rRNA C1402 N4-methylase RsmH